jgi:putative methionine-R-sulfoxide reductase with GAF domain
MPVRLSAHLLDGPVRVFLLDEGKAYRLGRGADCEVVLDDPRVSRYHARIEGERNRWTLSDLGSKNGVTVDGKPVPVDHAAELPGEAWVGLGGPMIHVQRISEEARRSRTEQDLRRSQTSLVLAARLRPAENLGQLLQQLLASALSVSGAERGFVLLTRNDGELEVAARSGLEDQEVAEPAFAGSVAAVRRTLAEQRPVVVSDAQADRLLSARPSVIEESIRALVCLPLEVMGRFLGVLYADSRRSGSGFTELDVEILSALASHAALAVAVVRLHRELARLEQELPAATATGLPGAGVAGLWERSLPSYRGSTEAPRPAAPLPPAATTWSDIEAIHDAARREGS